jgi:hypothetical protein
VCRGCAVNTMHLNEYYMLHDDVWVRAMEGVTGQTTSNGMLCVRCVENGLGRELRPQDFTDAPINHKIFDMSQRLVSRLLGIREEDVV